MDKSKLTSIGERLKSTSSQMSRTLTLKLNQMKDLLQSPTPESRIVDQATSPTLESSDWGLNLRICSLINSQELVSAEIVKSIKRKIVNVGDDNDADIMQQRLALELLEACAMNCEKVFSEIASEKVVEEMVEKVIDNPKSDTECKVRVLELVRAWGESEDLSYLPVFRQTYENLKRRAMSSHADDGTFPVTDHSLESYMDQHPISPPESYPLPGTGLDGTSGVPYHYDGLSTEQTKEFLEITRNSLDVLSSLLGSTSEPKAVEDDLTISMVDKCKDSQPMLQSIVQSITDDEGLLFEALNLNDELQKAISKFEEMHISATPTVQQSVELKGSEASVPNESTGSLAQNHTKPDGEDLFKDDITKSERVDPLNEVAESSEKSRCG